MAAEAPADHGGEGIAPGHRHQPGNEQRFEITPKQRDHGDEGEREVDRAEVAPVARFHGQEQAVTIGQGVDDDKGGRGDHRQPAILKERRRPPRPHPDRDVDDLARELDVELERPPQTLSQAQRGQDIGERNEDGQQVGHGREC